MEEGGGQKRASGPVELEVRTVVSYRVGAEVQEQPVLLTHRAISPAPIFFFF